MADYINRDVKNLSARRGSRASKIAAGAAILAVGVGGSFLQDRHESAVRNQETNAAFKQDHDAKVEYARWQKGLSSRRVQPKPSGM